MSTEIYNPKSYLKKLNSLCKNLMLILCIMVPYLGKSQTTVSGGVYYNTTWFASQSPYIVSADLIIFYKATLKIEPGVKVLFQPGTSMEVRGTLLAEGTYQDSIIFSKYQKPYSYDSSNWKGILFREFSSSKIQYLKGQDADTLINLKEKNYEISISKLAVTNNRIGLYSRITHIDLLASDFINNSTGIIAPSYNIFQCSFIKNDIGINRIFFSTIKYGENTPSFIIRFSTFESNRQYGVFNGAGNISDSKFTFNKSGVSYDVSGENTFFTNNEITYNDMGLILIGEYQASTNLISNNSICKNRIFNIDNQVKDGNIDASHNYWCTEDSAAISKTIWDGYKDISKGLVSYNGYLAQPTETTNTNTKTLSQEKLVLNSFPNPANNFTIISYYLDQASFVQLALYASSGMEKEIIINESKQKGFHEMKILTSELPEGMYFLKLRTEAGYTDKKFMILKE